MFTNYMLIQKIDQNCRFEQFFAQSSNIIWSFIERGKISTDKDDTFPFEIHSSVDFKNIPKGRETKIIEYKDKQMFKFAENYSVISGFVIALVFPKNYIPISMNFGERAHIPIGEVKSEPPGYLEILYNSMEKQCTIIFTINKQANFQFSCIGSFCKNDFPSRLQNYQGGTLSATIIANNIGNIAIKSSDLLKFKEYFKHDSNLTQIAKDLNNLKDMISSCTLDDGEEDRVSKSITKSFSTSINYSSAFTTLIDSYNNSGIVHKFISSILLNFFNN